MAIPPNATAFSQPMDPSDLMDFQIILTQGGDDKNFLAISESPASYTLALSAEAIAAGLTIKTDGGYSTTLVGLTIRFWLTVATAQQGSAGFNSTGLDLPMELTVTTNSAPARIKQRTFVVKVQNQ